LRCAREYREAACFYRWRVDMKKNRYRRLGFVLFVLYLVLLTYFLFFAEEMGRSPDERGVYRYNLVLFKEIRRFIVYRELLGWRAVFLNIFGNVLAFMPFGFFLPVIWKRLHHFYTVTLLSFTMSLGVETLQLVMRVGSFDVDDLLLNTIGGLAGYVVFSLAKGVWNRYSGTDRE
jgi:glycopeptide antibiotics resistance protein